MPNIELISTYIAIAVIVFIILPLLMHISFFQTRAFIGIYKAIKNIEAYAALANTLIHELSHGIIAIATGGSIQKITLHRDTSGLAITKTKRSRLIRALVSYAGYTGSSAAAIGLFYLLSEAKYEWILYIFLGVAVVSALFWVRNGYGFLWTVSFVAIIGYILYKQYTLFILHTSILLSVVVLVDSVTSAYTICRLSITNRKEAGDATSLAQATFIPAMLWGIVFFGQALFAVYYIAKTFLHIAI